MRFGDIVLLDYPFTDGSGAKRRPGLVLLPEVDGDVLFARITSKQRVSEIDVTIEDWKSVGLAYPSTVRLSKMVSLHSDLVLRRFGVLTPRHLESVLKGLGRLLANIRR